MGFFDFLKPAWQNSDASVRLAAVAKETEPSKLQQMARGAKHEDVRTAATQKLVQHIVKSSVAALIIVYERSNNQGFYTGSSAAEPVRALGRHLDQLGGKPLMLAVHAAFADERPRMARNLEMVWDGIGGWAG